jgi:hypothetical protein
VINLSDIDTKKVVRGFVWLWLLSFVLGVALLGTLGAVIWHFVSKFW